MKIAKRDVSYSTFFCSLWNHAPHEWIYGVQERVLVIVGSCDSQTFNTNWYVEYIWGFFRHSNNAERKNISFFILMSRSKKVAAVLLPFSLCNYSLSGYIHEITFKCSSIIDCIQIIKKAETSHDFLAFIKSFLWRSSIHPLS